MDPDSNADLARILAAIADEYRARKDTYREKSYRSAAIQIRKHPTAITSGSQARRDIKGIGKTIEENVDEYIQTGTIGRLAELRGEESGIKVQGGGSGAGEAGGGAGAVTAGRVEDEKDEHHSTVKYFESFYGIGPATAEVYYKAGHRTLYDLWNKAPLTPAQRLGILWREHLALKIPRREMDVIRDEIARVMEDIPRYTAKDEAPPVLRKRLGGGAKDDANMAPVEWEMLGSYRRMEPESGDIDLAIKLSPGIDLKSIVESLRPYLVGDLAYGEFKYMGIYRLSSDWNAHRIDIRTFEPQIWPYAVMYFTGSQNFNILMRRRANDLGLNLSEYSLTGKGKVYPAETEEDIFAALGVKYIPPEDRVRDISELPLV